MPCEGWLMMRRGAVDVLGRQQTIKAELVEFILTLTLIVTDAENLQTSGLVLNQLLNQLFFPPITEKQSKNGHLFSDYKTSSGYQCSLEELASREEEIKYVCSRKEGLSPGGSLREKLPDTLLLHNDKIFLQGKGNLMLV